MTRQENRDRLTSEMLLFLRLSYPTAAEISLMPKAQGAQAQAFNDWKDWHGAAMSELALKLNAVDLAASDVAADAVQLDLGTLAASDPHLEIQDFIRL